MSNPYMQEAEEYRKAIDTFAKNQSDETLIDNKTAFEFWRAGINAVKDKIYRYGENIYKCIQPHTTQADWTPDITPALYNKITAAEWEKWEPNNFYAKGAKVTHNNKKWISNVDNNHWEPGAAGVYTWTEYTG